MVLVDKEMGFGGVDDRFSSNHDLRKKLGTISMLCQHLSKLERKTEVWTKHNFRYQFSLSLGKSAMGPFIVESTREKH